jgi:DNA invertase Pin-like site-specific DNA recombinase
VNIGYARTSTIEQVAGLEAQERDLTALGCDRIFSERISSVAEREQLNQAIEFSREGDVFIVTKLDRLARSLQDLLGIMSRLEAKGVKLRVIDMGLDTATSTGRLIVNIVGSIGQFEREIMLERQREGIARAKAMGRYKGRYPTARNKTEQIISLQQNGVRPSEIGRRLGVSRASVYRILLDQNQKSKESLTSTDNLGLV